MKVSRLLYASSFEELKQPKVIFQSEHGIPVGWIVLFGGRNFCEPDQKVSERGGTSADRDRWTTPQEVAEARLGNAIEGFSEFPHLWPWFSPLNLLHRKSLTLGKSGVYKLEAPWLFSDQHRTEAFNRTTAIMENVVNSLISDQLARVPQMLESLDDFVLFTPHYNKNDVKRFHAYASDQKAEHLHALGQACLGKPLENIDRFHSILKKDCEEVVGKLGDLPPYPTLPTPEPITSKKAKNGPVAKKGADEKGSESSGIVGKFKGLFKKS